MIYSLPLLIASDHAGFPLKKLLKAYRPRINWKDVGPFTKDRTDYPDWAEKLGSQMQEDLFGVLICGTGQGMCMKSNKMPNIRAALCWNKEIAKLSRAHNNANVLCLPGRFLSLEKSLNILDTFLETKFDDNPVYQRRVKKIK